MLLRIVAIYEFSQPMDSPAVRALRLHAARGASVVQSPDPVPGPGEVLVRIRACGVCGSDLNAWRGVPGIEYPLNPGAPGHETYGEVLNVGAGVHSLQRGDRVTGLMWNGLAELGVARAADLVVVPETLRESVVLGEPLACAMNVVRRAGIRAQDRLALVGFGYLAALVAQLLPTETGPWVVVSRRADSRALALRLGAAAAYDFAGIPSVMWDAFPVVIEAAGFQRTLDCATWLTAYGGRLVIAGYHADGPRTVDMQSWNWKGIDVVNAHERDAVVSMGALRSAFELMRRRPIDLSGLHTHTWPLDRAAEAFLMAEQRPPGFVKAVIRP